MPRCVYPQCSKVPGQKSTLFNFPFMLTDSERRDVWLELIGLEESELSGEGRICEKHFHHKYVIRMPNGPNRLKKDAVPLVVEKPKSKKSMAKPIQKPKPSSSCSVIGCENESHKSNNNIKYFSFPYDSKMKRVWVKNCGQQPDWRPSVNMKVCSTHFFCGRPTKDRPAPILLIPHDSDNDDGQMESTCGTADFEFDKRDTRHMEHDYSRTNANAIDSDLVSIKMEQLSDSHEGDSDQTSRSIAPSIPCATAWVKCGKELNVRVKEEPEDGQGYNGIVHGLVEVKTDIVDS